MNQVAKFSQIIIIILVLLHCTGCTNTSEALKNAQEHIKNEYPELDLTIACMFSNWNEAYAESINEYKFIAVDKKGIKVVGQWNNKQNSMSNLRDDYANSLKMAKYEEELKQLLPNNLETDIYCTKRNQSKKQVLNIEIFCFNNIQSIYNDQFVLQTKEAIDLFCNKNNESDYNAIIYFTYNGARKHPSKPYSQWKSNDLSKQNWEFYDSYLTFYINKSKDNESVSDINVGGGYFASKLKEDVGTKLSNGNNSFCRFFLVDKKNLEDVFFVYEINKNNNYTTLISGFYNLNTKAISDTKNHELPRKKYTNKELKYLIPIEYQTDNE